MGNRNSVAAEARLTEALEKFETSFEEGHEKKDILKLLREEIEALTADRGRLQDELRAAEQNARRLKKANEDVSKRISSVIKTISNLVIIIFILRLLLQWVRVDFYSPVSQFVFRATNPLVAPIQKILPRSRLIDIPGAIVVGLTTDWWGNVYACVSSIFGAPGKGAYRINQMGEASLLPGTDNMDGCNALTFDRQG